MKPVQLAPDPLKDFILSNNLVLPPTSITIVYRVELRGITYYSRQYERVTKRNSYTIAYLDTDGCNRFALIIFCSIRIEL